MDSGVIIGAVALLLTLVNYLISTGKWAGNRVDYKQFEELRKELTDTISRFNTTQTTLRHALREELQKKEAQYWEQVKDRLDDFEQRMRYQERRRG